MTGVAHPNFPSGGHNTRCELRSTKLYAAFQPAELAVPI